MTKPETRIKSEARMTNVETKDGESVAPGFVSSFYIRISFEDSSF